MRYFILVFVSCLFLGCSKDFNDLNSSDQYVNLSAVMVVNAVPNSVDVNVFQNSKQDLLIPASEELKFGDVVKYRNAMPGLRTLLIDSYPENGKTESVEGRVDFQTNKVYSLFVIKEDKLNYLLAEDKVISPSSAKAKIRFVNLVHEIGEVSVNEISDFKDVDFKEVTDFKEIDVNTEFRFSTKTKATSKEYNLQNFIPLNGSIYTIMLIGSKNSAEENTQVRLKVIRH